MESTSELAWFRSEVLRSIVRPRSFARSLARDHFGLAGILIVVVAGMAFSLTIDGLVLAAKGMSLENFVARLLIEAVLLGARIAVSVSVVALIVFLGGRAARQSDLTLDQSFNAVAFAFAPLIVAPIPPLLALFEPNLLILAGVILLFIGLRALAGLALVLALTSGWLVLGDQISRVRMTAYAIAPSSPLRSARHRRRESATTCPAPPSSSPRRGRTPCVACRERSRTSRHRARLST